MMATLRFLLWTGLCVALGIGMATVEVGGHTPWSHLQRLWRHEGVKLVEEVKQKVASAPPEPKETHTKADRDAVADIIARRRPAP